MVGRPDLLAGIGVLGGFLLYLVGVEATGRLRWAVLAGAAAATAIGVFSKESAVTVLGVIAIYELAWWKERRNLRGRPAALAAVAIPIAAMLFVRMQVMAHLPPASFPFIDNPLVNAGFLQGRLTALAILARYLWRLVCPITLSADYSYAQIPLVSGALADWVSWLVVAALAVLAVRSYRWNRTAFFFAGFAAATLLPTSNLLFPIGTIMAERFLYLPSVAFCACLVLCYGAIPPRLRAAAPWVVGVLVTAYAVRTWLRNPDWRDEMHMAQALVKTSPNSFKVRKMLAFQLYQADAAHSRVDQAIAEAEAGIAVLDPLPNEENFSEAYRLAGGYYYTKGELLRGHGAEGSLVAPPACVPWFRRSAELLNRALAIMGWAGDEFSARAAGPQPNADAGVCYRVLSQIGLRLDDVQTAYSTAGRAVAADPLSADANLQLARVLARSGQSERAAVALIEGNALTPDRRFTNELLPLLKGGLDPRSCALKPLGQGFVLDPACDSVRRLLCPALDGAIAVRMHMGRPDLAQQLRDGGLSQYGCHAAP
jgi:tetratricopeptide (TPR) repeat protein